MLARTLFAALVLGVLPIARDGAADVARIREELKELRSKQELRSDEKIVGAWLDTLWKAADEAKDDNELANALLLAQEVAEQCTTAQAKEWRPKVRTRLIERFADDEKRMSALMRASNSVETRNEVFAKTKNKAIKASCVWADALVLLTQQRKEKLGPEDQKKLDSLLASLRKEYGDELDSRGRRWADVVEGRLRAANDLVIGKVAPDIEGKDLDGVPFKLSDYRGKIVVLDFWGNW